VLRTRVCRVACLALVAAACEEEGYRLELSIHASDEAALVHGATVMVRVRDRQTRDRALVAMSTLAGDLGEGPFEVGLDLNGGGAYDAHVLVDAPDGRWYATRCYSIGGTKTSAVLLAGPLDRATDEDGDGWPVEDDCKDPGGGACADPCPPLRADDCNEDEPEIHPAAADLCQDQIDQDCSGTDALCAEDEGPDT
jgi:hypothetical protein